MSDLYAEIDGWRTRATAAEAFLEACRALHAEKDTAITSLRAQLAAETAKREEAEARLKEWECYRDQDHEMGRAWTPEYGCGDNSCAFRTERKGMGTNGGCRCHENPQVARKVFRLLRTAHAETRQELASLKEVLYADPNHATPDERGVQVYRRGWWREVEKHEATCQRLERVEGLLSQWVAEYPDATEGCGTRPWAVLTASRDALNSTPTGEDT